ncbi:MAG: hypothetical protein REH79_00395 [Spiroplasma sp.]|nr:hypothetical protein [Spiroplasma sp.]
MENHQLSKIKINLKKLRKNLENFYDKFVPLKVVKHINNLFKENHEEAKKWITTFNSFKITGMTFLYLEQIIEDYEKAIQYTESQYAMFNEWIINNTYSLLVNLAIELKFFETIYLTEETKKINLNTLSKLLKTNLDYFDKYSHLFPKGLYEYDVIKLTFARNVLQHPLNVYENNFKEIFPHVQEPAPIYVDRISASVVQVGQPKDYKEHYSITFKVVQPILNMTNEDFKFKSSYIRINVFELLSQILVFINEIIENFYSNFEIK